MGLLDRMRAIDEKREAAGDDSRYSDDYEYDSGSGIATRDNNRTVSKRNSANQRASSGVQLICVHCGHRLLSRSRSGRTRCPNCKERVYMPAELRGKSGLTLQKCCPHCGGKL